MNTKKLSAVIITFNEEKNIARCIDSISAIAEEIIILDSFSADQTVSIATARDNVKVYQREWAGYSDAKNFADSLTSYEYIFSIDADEEVTKELQKSILKIKNEGFNSDAYEVNRLTNYCGRWIRHGGWYPEYKIRIFKKVIATWRGTVHEELIFNAPVKIKRLEGNLNHYSFPSIDHHLKKITKYSVLAATKDIEAGKKFNFIMHGFFKPAFTFVRKYFLQLGFMDGFYGFVIATISAFERFLRYAKFLELTKKH